MNKRAKISPYRKDWEFTLIRGNPFHSRAAYALVITTRDRENKRSVFHIENFYGQHAGKLRSEALRRFYALLGGAPIDDFRSIYLSAIYPRSPLQQFLEG